MKIRNMEDLFLHGLKDIYYAEKKILNALPKMAKAAHSEELRDALQAHLKETEQHVRRLEQVFENRGEKAQGKTCPAIEGLVKEGEEVIEEVTDADVRSAALLADAQAVEHYEIARYGTLCAWAKLLGDENSLELLHRTLEEEKHADRRLNDIADKTVNREAA